MKSGADRPPLQACGDRDTHDLAEDVEHEPDNGTYDDNTNEQLQKLDGNSDHFRLLCGRGTQGGGVGSMTVNRRGFLIGLGVAVAAPAIVRPSILMPIKQMLWGDGITLTSMAHPEPNPWNNMVAADLNEESLLTLLKEVRRIGTKPFIISPRYLIFPPK
jgi:hypothetical protein